MDYQASKVMSSVSRVKRNLHFPSVESTPTLSRKRKSSDASIISQHNSPFSNYNHDDSFINNLSPIVLNEENVKSKVCFDQSGFEISELKLSLQKCNLEESSPKKYKWDNEELECLPKSNSAPGTPTRSDSETDHIRKYYSLDLTPTKKYVKIGTPERFEILYPTLVEVKPKSPSKLRFELKRSKQARKRLFQSRDFVHVFTNIKKVDHIIYYIFSYLNDSDLVNIVQVSPTWKKALENDPQSLKRYKMHKRLINNSKENIYLSPPINNNNNNNDSTIVSCLINKKNNLQPSKATSPPVSPVRENWRKFTKMAAQLNSSQGLKKCLICNQPSVFERGIAKCSRYNCGYLWCTKCLSSAKNPEDLICYCSGPRSPPSPSDRNFLSDRSNFDDSTAYYFMDSSQNVPTNLSSGYFSQSDIEKSVDKSSLKILTDSNDNPVIKRSSINNNEKNVLEYSAAIQKARRSLSKQKEVEPKSPQKGKMHPVGSKQCKKNLRRLCL